MELQNNCTLSMLNRDIYPCVEAGLFIRIHLTRIDNCFIYDTLGYLRYVYF